jgi:3-deoxy-D-manno-octulosonate 8-phosphate phosphatase (KDO 8-P phosphatase)
MTGAAMRASQMRYGAEKALLEQGARIKLVALDVDGVLTDGGVNVGALNGAPFEFKRFDIQDGLGIKFLQWAGIKVVIISGRISEATRLRAEELKVDDYAQDNLAQKLPALQAMCTKFGVTLEQVAFIGDDWPDMAVLQRVGLPVAVANAAPEVRDACLVRLQRPGGFGAVREFAEWLLKAQGKWAEVTAGYVAERSGKGA